MPITQNQLARALRIKPSDIDKVEKVELLEREDENFAIKRNVHIHLCDTFNQHDHMEAMASFLQVFVKIDCYYVQDLKESGKNRCNLFIDQNSLIRFVEYVKDENISHTNDPSPSNPTSRP